MTLAPEAPARVLRPSRARCRVITGIPRIGYRPTIPVIYPDGHTDELIVVETTSQKRLCQVRAATVDKPSWVLNGVGSMGVTVTAHNDALDHLVTPGSVVDGAGVMRLIGREIQFWRDGVMRWAGPPISAQVSTSGVVDLSCMDLGWHLARKFFGSAERKDLLRDTGLMDRAGLPGWSLAGSASKARSTADKVRGSGSMVLSGNGAAQASFLTPARPVAPAVHLTLMAKVPEGTPIGTRIATITTRTSGGTVIAEASIVVDGQTKFDVWERHTAYARQRVGIVNFDTVTLWSSGDHGDTKFDDVRVLENDTTGIPSPGKDLVNHIKAGLDHMQGGAGQGVGFGFGFEILTYTGTVEVLGERHLNHKQWTDFLNQYTSRSDGLDWRIDPARRVLQVGKRIGVDHTNISLHERSVHAGGWVHDESTIAAKVVVPGDGDGVDRPEGGYWDTSRTAGLTYDDFWQPPADTPLSALDRIAEQRWDEVSQPQISFDQLAVTDDLLGTVGPGDTITGTMKIGKVRLPRDTPVRVGQVALDVEAGQLVLN